MSPAHTTPYNNDTSQLIRKETLRNDQRVRTSSYFDQARIGAALAKDGAANIYSGEHEHVGYPKLPDTSPWSGPQPGQEMPLGFSVDAQEPTGNFHEVQQSIDSQSASLHLGASGAAGGDNHSEADGSSPSTHSSTTNAVYSPAEVVDAAGSSRVTHHSPVPAPTSHGVEGPANPPTIQIHRRRIV